MEQQRLLEQQKLKEFELQREMERMRLQQQQEMLKQQEQYGLAQQVEYLRQQNQRDRQTISEYELRFSQLQNQFSLMQQQLQNNAGDGDKIKKLMDEIEQWKQKYEALAKLYAQLRKEHLDLLQKLKSIKEGNTKSAEEARKRVEQVQEELRKKGEELTTVLVERNGLRGEAERVRNAYEAELLKQRQELEQARKTLLEMSTNKGMEVQNLITRFANEQSKLEEMVRAKQAEVNLISSQLTSTVSALETSKNEHEEERAILQASLDQALEILRQHQEQSASSVMTRDERIAQLEAKHQELLYQMMDNVFDTCITTISDQLYQLDAPGASVAPEFVLSLIEKVNQKCSDLSSSLVKVVNGGDPKDAITHSSALAQTVAQLLRNGREMERLAQDHEAENVILFLKQGGQSAIHFFQQVKSSAMVFVAAQSRPEHIVNLSRETQVQIGKLVPILEKLSSSKKVEGDLADAVEREMANAAKAIEEASKRLHTLIQTPNLDVHSAILQAAIAITTAISNLIKCATDTQQEIVQHQKGSATTTQFYKKNNKWTEGLISAARTVSGATVYLVEVADGLTKKTHSWEQLVVAAQEVGVSTTQLVAAARVKSQPYSKTQARLEQAAVAVREATQMLVKAAKEVSKLGAEEEVRNQVGKMSKHEAKVKEMEQQVKILELEKKLTMARFALGEMRKAGYHEEE